MNLNEKFNNQSNVIPVAENFSTENFLGQPDWETIEAKTSFFAPYFRKLRSEGGVMREVLSPHGPKMRVFDPVSQKPCDVLMFGSNNYLNFANEPYIIEKTIESIREFGIGIGGPPILNGTTTLHRKLERKLAEMKNTEDAIIFSSGYAANVGWCTALLKKGDFLVFDSLSHASLFDGIKMGRFEAIPFAHNSLEDLRQKLMQIRWQHPYTNIVVCVEGVYSMDGDISPLEDIVRMSKKYGAFVVIDDAHGLGVMGEKGHGTHEHFGIKNIDLILGTFSKTLASTGGFLAGSSDVIDYLRWHARSFMFSASLPPTIIASVLAGLEFLEQHPERVTKLKENSQYMYKGLKDCGFKVSCESAIIPVLSPPNVEVLKIPNKLFQEGVFVNAIIYPAVPKNMQRLRISMMSAFSKEDLDFAIEKFRKVGKEFEVI